MNKKRILFAFVGAVLVVLLFLVVSYLRTSTIDIKTNPGAEIFVSEGSRSNFKKVGQTRAVYKTTSTDSVFVEVRSDDQVAQKSVQPKRRQTIRLELLIEDKVPVELIAPGPLSNIFVTDKYVYGINPSTSSLMAQPIGRPVDVADLPPVNLPVLPFMKKIIWFDKDNFIFIGQNGNAYFVKDGKQVAPTSEGPSLFSTQVAQSGDIFFFLESSGEVFSSNNRFLEKPTKVASAPNNSSPSLFADERYGILVSAVYASVDDEADTAEVLDTELTVIDRDGKIASEYTLDIKKPIEKMVSVSEKRLAALSEDKVIFINLEDGSVSIEEFKLGKVKDLVVNDDRLLLLGDSGLWEYSDNTKNYQRLADFPKGEEYVENSLVFSQNYLYFSSQIEQGELLKTDTSAGSGIYRISI